MTEHTYRVLRGIILGVILTGAGMLLYPAAANLWNACFTSRAMSDYQDRVSAMSPKEVERRLDEAREFNRKLKNTPDRFRLPGDLKEEYYRTLDVSGTGIIGMVHIPSIGVHVPVYHGNSDAVLQVAAGHMEGTSFPVGDAGSHAVIAAHTGLASAKLFTKLDELGEGDAFFVTILDQEFGYRVTGRDVVLPEETGGLSIPEDGSTCTLLTCTPFGVNSHRLLVFGTFTGMEERASYGEQPGQRILLYRILFGGLALAGSALILRAWKRARK